MTTTDPVLHLIVICPRINSTFYRRIKNLSLPVDTQRRKSYQYSLQVRYSHVCRWSLILFKLFFHVLNKVIKMRLTFSNLSIVMNIVNTIQTRFMVSFKINVPYCNLILISKFSIWKLYIKKDLKFLNFMQSITSMSQIIQLVSTYKYVPKMSE